MHISYDKLWHILLDRHMTREFLRKECSISSNTIAKLGKGQNVTTDVLVKICTYLNCELSEIMELVPDDQ